MHTLQRGSFRGRLVTVALALCAAGVTLGACSSPKHAVGPTTTSTTPATSTTSTPAPPRSSSTTELPAPTCSTAVLDISASAGGSAAGTTTETFTLTNNGPSACSLSGFPGVAFYGASGAAGTGAGPKLAISTVDGQGPVTPVVLQPSGTAAFLLVYSDVPVNGAGCADVASVEVTPPGSGESLALPVQLQPCGGSVTVDKVAAPGSESG